MPIHNQPDLVLENFRTESNPIINIVNATNRRILANNSERGRGLLEELLLGSGNGQSSLFGNTNMLDSIFKEFNNDNSAFTQQQTGSPLLNEL